MITAQQLVDSARTLIGTPYRHQGRTERAVDCIGFLFAACKGAGLDLISELPAPEEGMPQWNYGRAPDARALKHTLSWCSLTVTETGAIVLFKFPGAPHPQHFGILGEEGKTVIHAHQPMKRVVEHGYRHPWVRWEHGIYRVPGVAYGK